MKRIYKLIAGAYVKKIDATGLSVFRIFYCLVLFMEVLQLFYFRHLVFDTVPYLQPQELNFGPIIIVWMVTIVFLMIGLFSRTAAILNYVFTVLFFGLCSTFEYHMFFVYTGINFLLMFLPVSTSWSLDRLFVKLKYSNTRNLYDPPRTVSQLAYTIPLLLSVAFVYFDSIFFKSVSPMWLHGLGLWLPASMPLDVNMDLSFILNMEWLSKFLGYLTLVFELVFLFLFWFKKFRLPLFITGVGLHLGILITFPIPWFALGVIAIYMLLLPVGCWKKLKRSRVKSPRLSFYYDNECPLCTRTRIVISHFDVRKRIHFLPVQTHSKDQSAFHHLSTDDLLRDIYSVNQKGKVFSGYDTYIQVAKSIPWMKPLSWFMRIPGIYHLGKKIYGTVARNRTTERCTEENCGYTPPEIPDGNDNIKILHGMTLADLKVAGITAGLVVLTLFQVIISLNSDAPAKVFRRVFGKEDKRNIVRSLSLGLKSFTKPFLGITNHGVFMDHHLLTYNHLFAVAYQRPGGGEDWLPMTQPSGMPGWYNTGSELTNWTFRVNNPRVSQKNVLEGIKRYTAFWAEKHNVSLKDARFVIREKEIESSLVWQKDFLARQIAKPWRDIGFVQWQDEHFSSTIENIEGL